MENSILREGVWYTQTNGCTYQVLSIDERTGEYEAEGIGYDGTYNLRCSFGHINDDVLEDIREATDEEIQHALSLQDGNAN